MKFGVLKDIKEGENRVICTPVEVASIVAAGHTVYVQKGAGVGAGFPDEKSAYRLHLRLSTLSSAMGIFGSQLIPWHCYPVFFAGIASAVYPLSTFLPADLISHNYLSVIAVGSLLILTFTGLDRFVPMLALPGKDKIHLRK